MAPELSTYDTFTSRMASQRTLGIAVGVLMHERGYDASEASWWLWEEASILGIDVHDYATVVIAAARQ